MIGIEYTTKSGFTCKVDPRIMDSWDMLNILAESDSDDIGKKAASSVKVLRFVFGDEQLEKLKKHVAEKDGFVSTQKMCDEMWEVVTNIDKAGKNTRSSQG